MIFGTYLPSSPAIRGAHGRPCCVNLKFCCILDSLNTTFQHRSNISAFILLTRLSGYTLSQVCYAFIVGCLFFNLFIFFFILLVIDMMEPIFNVKWQSPITNGQSLEFHMNKDSLFHFIECCIMRSTVVITPLCVDKTSDIYKESEYFSRFHQMFESNRATGSDCNEMSSPSQQSF